MIVLIYVAVIFLVVGAVLFALCKFIKFIRRRQKLENTVSLDKAEAQHDLISNQTEVPQS